MNNFSFRTVPNIMLEWQAARRLGEILGAWSEHRRLLVVTDAGLHKAGLLEPTKASLAQHGFEVTIFDAVVADPPESVLAECVSLAAGSEAVLGLGGGSSLDVAKLAAVLLRTKQAIGDLYGIGKVQGSRAPLALVPTTAGTGSEVTNISIMTTGETTKMGVVAPQLFADLVILDAELTLGLPALHTAATGIDAMVHAIEAYTTRHKKNPISDALAREALRLLASNIVTACRDGSDRRAREAMLLGAMLAGQAFTNAPVAAVHALAYPLGGRYHIPHGLSNALMLGPVLAYNAPAVAHLYAELADVVLGPSDAPAAERARAFAGFMGDLMDRSGVPRRLRDVGVTEDSLPTLAADAMLQQRLLVNNPVELDESRALTLYREAF
ncbi:iron-containing alcohol dehydrogenase [Bradyrhizobium sp. AZCC 2289]|uniref:iron-containing alcohol dehydrogenase n=1 Tax=Bradyrhizobium sp. AZCC 2289 TaxID=3117026 RepID=UPI002FF2A5DA